MYAVAECGGKNFHFLHESADIGKVCLSLSFIIANSNSRASPRGHKSEKRKLSS